MNIPILLETVISIISLIILISIITSSLFELIESVVRRRSKYLRKAIEKALTDCNLNCNYAALFYSHPQIKTLQRSTVDYPSYILPDIFSEVLIDIIIQEFETEQLIYNRATQSYRLPEEIALKSQEEKLEMALMCMEYSEFGSLLLSFYNNLKEDETLEDKITNWYNNYMIRLRGWYKRATQRYLFIAGFLIAAAINFDLITVSSAIYENSNLREKLLIHAEGMKPLVESGLVTEEELQKLIVESYTKIQTFDLPIGWSLELIQNLDIQQVATMLLGWIATGLFVSRGSSFWFNAMTKLINLRSTGVKPGVNSIKTKDDE